MIELAAQSSGEGHSYTRGIAGDSYNTAVHLARQGLTVSYLTRLGDDALSDSIVQSLRKEGVNSELITRVAGRQPGLYLIENDDEGERSFTYWRDQSPARQLFDESLAVPDFDVLYFTGITLAITRSGFTQFQLWLEALRDRGCKIVFDPNYREALWECQDQAAQHYRQILPLCHLVLPTLEDEEKLWGLGGHEACKQHYQSFGIEELAIKAEKLTTYVFAGDETVERQAEPVVATDTTGAGDAFNAGYLASRLQGSSITEAVKLAQTLARNVVQHRGAIPPRQES